MAMKALALLALSFVSTSMAADVFQPQPQVVSLNFCVPSELSIEVARAQCEVLLAEYGVEFGGLFIHQCVDMPSGYTLPPNKFRVRPQPWCYEACDPGNEEVVCKGFKN